MHKSLLTVGLALAPTFIASGAPGEFKAKKSDLTYADREMWRPLLRWPDDCERAFALFHKSEAGLRFYALTSKTFLAHVSCAPGAYQGSQVFVFWDETRSPGSARLLEFPTYQPVGEKDTAVRKQNVTELWGTTTFSQKDKRLAVLTLFRGGGDCGWMGTYTFPQGNPRLELFRMKVECDGRLAGQPDRWRRLAATPP